MTGQSQGADPVAVLQKSMEALTRAVQALMGKMQGAASTASAAVAPAGGGGGGGGMNPGQMMGQMKTMALGAVAQITDAVVGTLQSIFGQLQQFVAALNPALIAAMGRAFHDLNAVIGIVAQEFGAMLLPVIRGVASALVPLMRQMAPIFGQIAAAMEGMLQPVINLFAKLVESMMPLLNVGANFAQSLIEPVRLLVQVLSGLLGAIMPLVSAFAAFQKIVLGIASVLVTVLMVALMPIILPLQILGTILSTVIDLFMQMIDKVLEPFLLVGKFVADVLTDLFRVVQILIQVFQAVVRAVADTIAKMLGFDQALDIKDLAKSLQEAFRSLLKAVLLTVAQFMKLFGMNSGIKAMIEAISGKRGDSNIGVANSPAFKAIGDLGRDLALQAFIASGEKTQGKEAKDWLAEITPMLEQILNDKTTESLMKTMPEAFAEAIWNKFQGSNAGKVYSGVESGLNAVTNPFGAAASAVRNAIRGGR